MTERVYKSGPVRPVRARAAKLLEDIINQIAKEENISNKRVDCILQSVFGTIAEDIRSGTLKGTHILHLGKFMVKPYNIEKYHKNNGSDTEDEG